MLRSFPVVYAASVETSAQFYEQLGFARHFTLPAEGEPGYIGLRRDGGEIAVVDRNWPLDQFSLEPGRSPMVELFIYVTDVDAALATLDARVLRAAEDMPWGERVGYVLDPDGNPVAVASPTAPE